jgi:hypothetical protein
MTLESNVQGSLCTIGMTAVFVLCLMTATALMAGEGNPVKYSTVPAKVGECCTVCGTPLNEEDVAVIMKGRRFPVDKSMLEVFLRNPQPYFRNQQLKSALFQEELEAPDGISQSGIGRGWFLLGLWVLTALLCGGLSGYAAPTKGLPPLACFVAGFAFNALGFLYVLARASRTSQQVPVRRRNAETAKSAIARVSAEKKSVAENETLGCRTFCGGRIPSFDEFL